ncbi:FAD-binding protein [Clostridium felsineum]|uniref:FAD-binding protein n=1 Tax=Clostridium felsineum TaxID=36839 RepID=UPI00098C2380|nr:FAD-binding protein [Clostridium felsineum]URZ17540.1 Fumarate reductase flavoprotein subunit [Clostridium felsineum DSM 794]
MNKILVIGSGLAGLSAAVKSAELEQEVILAAPSPSERSQSVMAMGGINAALNTKGQNDSIEEHYKDTIAGGNGLNDPSAVKKLTLDAPKILKWLDSLGTSFTRDENGSIDLRYFGGQKKMRTAYAGARTGKQLVTALVTECRKYEAQNKITRMNGWRMLSLILTEAKECAGAILLNEITNEIKAINSDVVIMATGGPNKVFGKTTGSCQCDGSATGSAFLQGVELGNPEMVQYHPTTISTPIKRMLITEAARGQGGRLFTFKNGKPWYFMEEWYPEMGALMPRDVVSRSIYKVCNEMKLGINNKNEVYLDITHLPKDLILTKLDEVVDVCMKYLELNPTKKPIPVYPGVHYFMGGIRTNANHNTNIPRLFAAGECSCQYHGANRLGGNSTLGAIHGGIISAIEASKLNKISTSEQNTASKKCLLSELEIYSKWKNEKYNDKLSLKKIQNSIQEIMVKSMGIYRKKEDLEKADTELLKLYKESLSVGKQGTYYECRSIPNTILVARAMIKGALSRKESRGAHQRLDYTSKDDKNFKKTTCVTYENKNIMVKFKNLI